MRNTLQKGASTLSGILTLIALIAIVIVTPRNGGNGGGGWDWTISGGAASGSDSGYALSSPAVYGGYAAENQPYTDSQSFMSIGTGNASYAYQSYEEYITLENHGNNPIDITGWELRNGKDDRPYYIGSTLQKLSADTVRIPQGTLSLSPAGGSVLQDIILGPGERAIITTGGVGAQTPYRITSFKENICTGYIETHADYAFSPPLNQNCPSPRYEPGQEHLEPACRAFIGTLSSCRTPEFNAKDELQANCTTCVNGERLSSQCYAYIKEHFSYQGCLAYHGSDPKFSSNTWRVFLGRGWEMWNKDYETIELLDRTGQLINWQRY